MHVWITDATVLRRSGRLAAGAAKRGDIRVLHAVGHRDRTMTASPAARHRAASLPLCLSASLLGCLTALCLRRPCAALRRRRSFCADAVPGLVVRDQDPRGFVCAACYHHRDLHLAGHDQEPEAQIVVRAQPTACTRMCTVARRGATRTAVRDR